MVNESIIEILKKPLTQPINMEKLILEHNITPWTPANLKQRIQDSIYNELFDSGSDSKVKMLLKSGAVVDPRSGLENVGHVLCESGSNQPFSCSLSLVDISLSLNSFHIIQIIS